MLLFIILTIIIILGIVIGVYYLGRFYNEKLLENIAKSKGAKFSGKFLNNGGLDIDPLFPVWMHCYDDRITFEFDDQELCIELNQILKVSTINDNTTQATGAQRAYKNLLGPTGSRQRTGAMLTAYGNMTGSGNSRWFNKEKKNKYIKISYTDPEKERKYSSICLLEVGKTLSNIEQFMSLKNSNEAEISNS